jgi:hypothetical protein
VAAPAAGALLRAAAAAGVAPAPACPLQPHLSRYAAHEAAKARKKDKHWVCQACGRSFSGEAWVDEHLRARHSGGGGGGALRALPLAGLCLADHCGMLGCPGLRGGAAAPPPRDAPEAPQRCLAVLAECFPEAAALAEEAAQGSGGASDASDAAAAARRAFYEQQRAALCASTPEQRERAWEAEAAALRAFKWTPLRAGSAAAGALLFLWLLRLIVLEDVRDPIKGVKARAREREAAAAAAARKQPGREREAAAPGAAEARRAEVAAAAREVAAARAEAAREVAAAREEAAREEAAREEAAGGAGGSGGGAGGSGGGLRFRG